MNSLGLISLTILAFVALPIWVAVKWANAGVPAAILAWAIYFGIFVLVLRAESSNWNEAFSWTMILNIFTGFGAAPVWIIAILIRGITAK